jgi:hypothetical protein
MSDEADELARRGRRPADLVGQAVRSLHHQAVSVSRPAQEMDLVMTFQDWWPIVGCFAASILFFGLSVEYSAYQQRRREQHREALRQARGIVSSQQSANVFHIVKGRQG